MRVRERERERERLVLWPSEKIDTDKVMIQCPLTLLVFVVILSPQRRLVQRNLTELA